MKFESLIHVIYDKQSQLCVGLDIKNGDKLKIAKTIIDETESYTAAYKPNRQFWLGYSLTEMQELNQYIHDKGCFSIIDHKLSDIGSSNIEALKYSKLEGFDLITISPFPGNIEQMCLEAEKIDIGLISLIMMSNPEAKWMIESPYLEWTDVAEKYRSNIVIGTTNHVSEEIIEAIAQRFKSGIVLAPGIGSQGGNTHLIAKYFGNRVIFNVSRGIGTADNYHNAAKKYCEMISKTYTEVNRM